MTYFETGPNYFQHHLMFLTIINQQLFNKGSPLCLFAVHATVDVQTRLCTDERGKCRDSGRWPLTFCLSVHATDHLQTWLQPSRRGRYTRTFISDWSIEQSCLLKNKASKLKIEIFQILKRKCHSSFQIDNR